MISDFLQGYICGAVMMLAAVIVGFVITTITTYVGRNNGHQ